MLRRRGKSGWDRDKSVLPYHMDDSSRTIKTRERTTRSNQPEFKTTTTDILWKLKIRKETFG